MLGVLSDKKLDRIFASLETANTQFMKHFPGDGPSVQPVHTVYGGAQLYKAGTAVKIGGLAQAHFQQYAPSANVLNQALGNIWNANFAEVIYAKVSERLKRCPVEDYRIDFEDGYGHRTDEEEDATATFAAQELARDMLESTAPPFIGIRIKSFANESMRRAVRTMDIFISTLLRHSKGKLPSNFVITLPKVQIPQQIEACILVLETLELGHQLPTGSLKIELMIESTPAVIDAFGRVTLPHFLHATTGRCRGVHFGTYDYTASCDITAAQQRMDHPACDFALNIMKNSLAGTGIWLSDGATSTMPVPIHRIEKAGIALSDAQLEENIKSVHLAWKLSYQHISHSLENGIYQGWDLHPGQISVRYAALYAFFLSGLDLAATRLHNFVDRAAQATLVGNAFDDAATGQGLLNYFLRANNCGAITEREITASGLSLAEIRTKNFSTILKSRRDKSND